jgi:3-hydroxyacyl-CoA dehydrogenase
LAEAQAAEIKKLGVIGAGQMVRGIAQVIARDIKD